METFEYASYRETSYCVLSMFFSRSEKCRFRCHRRSLELSSVFFVASLLCRGTWLIELVAKLGLRPPLCCLRQHSRGTLWVDPVKNSRRVRGCCPGRHPLRFTIIASVVVVDSPQSYNGLPRGRWHGENMPCKFDEILHCKSNSSPEAVCLPGY